ncbi:ABC transporter permease [Rhodococcus sp. Chr-9]|uniref:ABC transporter permease n=1 Tax=Rhodococcus sp. Chr-9 TaxID=713612 RepID=UPI000573B12F|nr:ABC transporter permease [Rhodococcus sp. Chr-9]KHJ73308.1 peptide ABC transporter permease [Rhodococcus sp. Chr-9]
MSETVETQQARARSRERAGTPGRAFAYPEPDRIRSESSLGALWEHSRLQCGRLLLRWARDPATMIQALIYPALTLVMFRIVLGDSITAATGYSSIFGTVPMIVLVGAMFGSVVSAVGLRTERDSGLLSRFHTLPVHRSAGLVGRLMAEMVRVFVTSLVIFAAGMALGFRFTQGLGPTLLILVVPLIFGLGFAMMVTALATLPGRTPLVETVSILCTLLMFFNSGFVPVMAYPSWLQPVVANQPMSCAIDTMRSLAMGGPIAEPFLKTLLWSAGMVAIFVLPALRGYRHAAQTG